jgi:hypothetical protein
MARESDEVLESRLLAYAGSEYWQAVRGALADQDRRVMTFGPSENSGLVHVTYFVVRLLEKFGLEPHLPSEHGTVDFEIGRALEFPYIVSLVRTVGTAAETLTLLHRITQAAGPQPRLLVVVPAEHRFGYFSQAVVQQFHAALETCSSTTCADADLAILVLKGIGSMVLSNQQIRRARELSNVPFPASDQDRKSVASNPALHRKTWQGGSADYASS